MTTRRPRRVSIDTRSIPAQPGRTKGASEEIGPPASHIQRDKFIVYVRLSARIGTKPVLDVRRIFGGVGPGHEGQPPVPLPFEVAEGSTHFFNGEAYLLFVSFGSRLALCPMDAVEILTVGIRDCNVGRLGDGQYNRCRRDGL